MEEHTPERSPFAGPGSSREDSPHTIESLLSAAEDEDAALEARLGACQRIEVLIEDGKQPVDVERFGRSLIDLWNKLQQRGQKSRDIFAQRIQVVGMLSKHERRIGRRSRIFAYYPEVQDVEGPDPVNEGKMIRGGLGGGSRGTSLYEFHWEYPIRGIGCRKDRIVVIGEEGQRRKLFDWCRENDFIVFCLRCGMEITYEVSKDCPARGVQESSDPADAAGDAET